MEMHWVAAEHSLTISTLDSQEITVTKLQLLKSFCEANQLMHKTPATNDVDLNLF